MEECIARAPAACRKRRAGQPPRALRLLHAAQEARLQLASLQGHATAAAASSQQALRNRGCSRRTLGVVRREDECHRLAQAQAHVWIQARVSRRHDCGDRGAAGAQHGRVEGGQGGAPGGRQARLAARATAACTRHMPAACLQNAVVAGIPGNKPCIRKPRQPRPAATQAHWCWARPPCRHGTPVCAADRHAAPPAPGLQRRHGRAWEECECYAPHLAGPNALINGSELGWSARTHPDSSAAAHPCCRPRTSPAS